jgi:hypothetical protein
VDCEEYPASQDIYEDPPFPSLQQSFVATNDYAVSQDIYEQPAPLAYLYEEDDQQDESQVSVTFDAIEEPSANFAMSFISSFSTHEVHSKRPRASDSPPSSVHRPEKYGWANDRASQRERK